MQELTIPLQLLRSLNLSALLQIRNSDCQEILFLSISELPPVWPDIGDAVLDIATMLSACIFLQNDSFIHCSRSRVNEWCMLHPCPPLEAAEHQ